MGFNLIKRMALFKQLMVFFIILSMVPLLLTGILVSQTAINGFEQETAQVAKQQASDWGSNTDTLFDFEVANINAVGETPSVYEACIVGHSWTMSQLYASYEGAEFGAEDGAPSLPDKTATTWDPLNDPCPNASLYLEDYYQNRGNIAEVFVTDTRGYAVATMTAMPGDFDQDGEEWYEDAVTKGINTRYTFDDSTQETVYEISIKLVKHETETFYGVIKAGIVFYQVLSAFENTAFYGAGFGVVVDKSSGEIVSAKNTALLGQPLNSFVSEAVYQ
ncbi:MAG: hypothetical protein ACFFC7_22755, partial [Candidatus Hermodarchaeota archaeon]